MLLLAKIILIVAALLIVAEIFNILLTAVDGALEALGF